VLEPDVFDEVFVEDESTITTVPSAGAVDVVVVVTSTST
jgi:hypothetical protein